MLSAHGKHQDSTSRRVDNLSQARLSTVCVECPADDNPFASLFQSRLTQAFRKQLQSISDEKGEVNSSFKRGTQAQARLLGQATQ